MEEVVITGAISTIKINTKYCLYCLYKYHSVNGAKAGCYLVQTTQWFRTYEAFLSPRTSFFMFCLLKCLYPDNISAVRKVPCPLVF